MPGGFFLGGSSDGETGCLQMGPGLRWTTHGCFSAGSLRMSLVLTHPLDSVLLAHLEHPVR